MTINYDLRDLIIFTHVAKLRSFARASEMLRITKSVVSARVVELEKQLNTTLLARTTRTVNLTSDGVKFFDYCQPLLEKVADLDNFIQNNKEVEGTLKVALPPYFSRHYIVPYLEEFLQKYPKLKLEFYLTENPINIIDVIYDIQVRIQIPDEEDLEVVKLMENKKLVCASKEYIQKHGQPQTPKDLLNHNCIIFGENNIWKFKDKKNKEIITIHDINGNIHCNNGEIIKELVLNGIGITIKSIVDVKDEITNGTIIRLLTNYEVENKTQFYATYPRGKYISLKTKTFIDFFRDKLKDVVL